MTNYYSFPDYSKIPATEVMRFLCRVRNRLQKGTTTEVQHNLEVIKMIEDEIAAIDSRLEYQRKQDMIRTIPYDKRNAGNYDR